MRYRLDYQLTHDIDWFFLCNGIAYHAASNGGLLPDKVDSRKNRLLQETLEDIDGEYLVRMSDWANQQDDDFTSFMEYAAKGFVSLDRNEDDGGRLRYHIVAFPANGEVFEDENLLRLMPVLNDNEIEITER